MGGRTTPIATEDPSRLGRLPRPDAALLAWALFAVVLLAAAIFFYRQTRGTTFWFDEWQWVLRRRGDDIGTFLEPHNGHLSLVPIAIYRVMVAIAGLGVYGPYRAMVIATHLGVVVLVFLYARRRVGPFPAVLAATLILFLGPAWQNFLWPFQVAWLLSLFGGLGALLMLDRRDRLGDAAACALLGLSLGSSGLGVPIAFGIGVDLVWGRRRPRDVWIVAIPVALYGVWWLVYQDARVYGELVDVPGFVADGASASLAALFGLAGDTVPRSRGTLLLWGRPLALIALGLFVWRVVQLGEIPPRVVALLAMVLSFWVVTELSRGTFSTPYESRYLYVGGLVLVLIAIEMARGISIPWQFTAAFAIVVAAAVTSNIAIVRAGAQYEREQGQATRAVLGAVEITKPFVRPDHKVGAIPGYPFVIIEVGWYFPIAEADGTPASTPEEIAGQPSYARRDADEELVRTHDIALEEAPRGARLGSKPQVVGASGGAVTSRGACVTFRRATPTPAPGPDQFEVVVPPTGLLVRSTGGAVELGIRRFADGFIAIEGQAATGASLLRIRADGASQPWRLRLAPAEGATACGLR